MENLKRRIYNMANCIKSTDLPECKNSHQTDTIKEPVWKCRYVVIFIVFIINIFLGTHAMVMSILMVAMVNNTAIDQNTKAKSESCSNLIKNSTEDGISPSIQTDGDLLWSPEIQGYIFGGYYIGSMLTQIPVSRLAERYGCKWIYAISLFIMGISNILVPPFSWWSFYAAIVIQIVRGGILGAALSCIFIIISNWSPKQERGCLFSIAMSGATMGPILGYVLAGYVSELPGGWTYVYYSQGVVLISLGLSVSFFVYESPKDHPRIKEAELNFILSNQETILSRKRPDLPWRHLLTSGPIYALIIVSFGRFWMVSQFFVVHSTFLGTILHYSIGQNGVFSALPNVVSFFFTQIACWVSLYIQKKDVVSVDFLRKFWTFISHLMYSLCLLGMYFAGCDRNLSVIFATFSMGATGLGVLGSLAALQDMSPTFAGTLGSICYTTGYIPGFILPLLVGYLTDEMRTIEQWYKVFFISIAVVMSTAIIFIIFGSAKIQPWNFVEENKKKDEVTKEKKLKDERNEEMTHF